MLNTISGIRINDNGKHALGGVPCGWVFIRIVCSLDTCLVNALKCRGISFEAKNMVQVGWFHHYLTEENAKFLEGYKDSIHVFKVERNFDFEALNKEESLLVHATKRWSPESNDASVRNYMTDEYYVVKGVKAETLAKDVRVDDITPVPKMSIV